MLWEHTNVPTFEQNEASAVHFHYNMLFWCREVITIMVSPLSSKKDKVLTPIPKHMSLFRNSIFCRQSSSDQELGFEEGC